MMVHYLIEFRFFGKAKRYIKELINEVDNKFNLRKGRKVPHITILAPFTTRNQKRLVSDFKSVCSKQKGLMHFKVNDFGNFQQAGVVYVDIKPDEKLISFRKELIKRLRGYSRLREYPKYEPHATIAMKLGLIGFWRINRYINSKPKPNFKNILMRVTLIKNKIILYEYDFMLRRLLNRREAKSKRMLSQTFKKIKKKLK